MVVTIYHRISGACDTRQLTSVKQLYAVRWSIARSSLLVFDRMWHLRTDVLNQGSTARYIQHLHSETDREQRYLLSFSGVDYLQIRFVFDCMNGTEIRVRILSIPEWIDVRIAPG